jgi:hypothetical protein
MPKVGLTVHQSIIIVSHRRSGTHLCVDAIANNFEIFSWSRRVPLVVLDGLSSHRGQVLSPKDLRTAFDGGARIFRTHSHGNIEDFFIGSTEIADCVKELFAGSKIILVYRDGRDVLVSLYYYYHSFSKETRNLEFSQFLRMINDADAQTYAGDLDRVSYWAFHVKSWLEKSNVLALSFEDLLGDYRKTLTRISDFIEQPLAPNLVDARIKPGSKATNLLRRAHRKFRKSLRIERVKHSTINFRKGRSGDWVNHFTEDDLRFFDERASEVMKLLQSPEPRSERTVFPGSS